MSGALPVVAIAPTAHNDVLVLLDELVPEWEQRDASLAPHELARRQRAEIRLLLDLLLAAPDGPGAAPAPLTVRPAEPDAGAEPGAGSILR